MSEADFQIVSHDEDGYEIVAASAIEERRSFTLSLAGAAAATEGRLADDEATARATVRFLLAHQDAGDLPDRVDLDEILAAYADAAEHITSRRE